MTALPFRAEHVGSFVRPDTLLEAVRAHRAGKLDADGLREAQDEAIRGIVAFQDDIGLPAVTDGEFRRRSWSAGVIDALSGFGLREEGVLGFKSESESGGVAPSPYAARRLERARPIVADDYRFLASLSPKGLPKATIASPPVLHFFLGPRAFDADAYADRDAYFADLVRIYRDEIADLAAAGCTYVQLDETALPCNCDAGARRGVRARGEDPDELTSAYVGLINAAVAERPEGMTVGLHMCRGNFKGAWMAEGGLRADRRARLPEPRRRHPAARIRHPARRRLRAAPLPAARQDRRARPDQHQDPRPGRPGRGQAPHRRGRPPRAAGTPRHRPAMRLLLGRRLRPARRFRRHPPQARPRPPDRLRGLGRRLTPPPPQHPARDRTRFPPHTPSPAVPTVIFIITNTMGTGRRRC